MVPEEYTVYSSMNFCTNIVQDYQYLIGVEKKNHSVIYPVLIGKGDETPRIWIHSPNDERIISDNVSGFSSVKCIIDFKNHSIVVKYEHQMVLEAHQEGDTCIVSSIDLTPFGFEIKGDLKTGLKIGTNSFSRNTFKNVSTMIMISDN